jgi:hypothetical protein
MLFETSNREIAAMTSAEQRESRVGDNATMQSDVGEQDLARFYAAADEQRAQALRSANGWAGKQDLVSFLATADERRARALRSINVR